MRCHKLFNIGALDFLFVPFHTDRTEKFVDCLELCSHWFRTVSSFYPLYIWKISFSLNLLFTKYSSPSIFARMGYQITAKSNSPGFIVRRVLIFYNAGNYVLLIKNRKLLKNRAYM